MRTFSSRAMVSWLLILVFPASMLAADSSAAMLYTNGTAWINRGTVPKSQAIFSGDLVHTRTDSVANIKPAGTSVLVFSDSLVQYQSSSVKLEHGSVDVGTSKSMSADAGGGGILNSPVAVGVGIGVVGGVAAWALSLSDDPLSPKHL